MSVLGWLNAFRAVKLGLKPSCDKASLRLEPVLCRYTGDVVIHLNRGFGVRLFLP